ncbi:MAG: 30S ribosomal protein S12 methylthiotransferase RimO [Myxococcales bacterium]|nr:30S ribosomal protein S12 methylthiotransferase RimO [Myxococcales bacterium]
MASVSVVTLGCPKNLVDAEVMSGFLRQEGFDLTRDLDAASVVVVNTCSFIEESKTESIDRILELAALKEGGACRLLAVTGCLAQRYADELAKELPEVDLFVGTGEYHRLPALISEGLRDKGQSIAVGPPRWLPGDETPRILGTHRYSAYLKVSEGCSRPCTFCIIPRLRGSNRSRDIESLVREARRLADEGTTELNLIAQDLTDFRKDLREERGLERLLRALAEIERLRWIRCLYLYPDGISSELVALLSGEARICSYADMPIQHVSDSVLVAMRRAGGERTVRASVERLRAAGVAVRTTVITGFPGETDADFRRLHDFVAEGHFTHLGAFPYSDEEGTRAFALEHRVPREEAEARRAALMELQQGISHARNTALVGRTVEVLCEGGSEETDLLLRGRTALQAPEIDGGVFITSGNLEPGEYVDVRITDAHPYDLVGEPITMPLRGADQFPVI